MAPKQRGAKVVAIERKLAASAAATTREEIAAATAAAPPACEESALPFALLRDLEVELRRCYSRLATPLNEYGYDPFGFDEKSAIYPAIVMTLFYRYWFRVETEGIANVPATGPVLVVANHAGNTYAWDATMIGTALFLEAEPPRLARGLGEFYLPTIPFFNVFMARMGSVVGTPENCRQLFERGECVLVFPEGSRGFVKPYSKAYQLQRFGLGFMRLALEHKVPILPVGVVGNEEQSPGLADVKALGKLIGSPAFPITITMPWLGPLGFVPLPVKFRLHFGPLMYFEGESDAEDGEIQPNVERVKREIERLMREGLARRSTWFW